jgi:ABC-type glycerol-3-phosphate transport system permease component
MAVYETTMPGEATRRRRLRISGWTIGQYAVLIIFLLIFLVPVIWIWSSAFKSSIEISRDPFGLPTELRWENLRKAWTVGGFDRYILNTVIYCVAIGAGVVALSCFAGYALALLPLPARGILLTVFLLGLMVPFQSVMIPIYYLLRDVNLLET